MPLTNETNDVGFAKLCARLLIMCVHNSTIPKQNYIANNILSFLLLFWLLILVIPSEWQSRQGDILLKHQPKCIILSTNINIWNYLPSSEWCLHRSQHSYNASQIQLVATQKCTFKAIDIIVCSLSSNLLHLHVLVTIHTVSDNWIG